MNLFPENIIILEKYCEISSSFTRID